jgi:type II secretory pathway component PulJ
MPLIQQPKPCNNFIQNRFHYSRRPDQNEQANYLFNQLLEERHKVEQHQQYFDELKHQLQMMMKEAERAVFTGGSVTWKKSQDSISLDSKSCLNSILNIYSSFHKPKQEHDDFRFIRMVDRADTHPAFFSNKRINHQLRQTTDPIPQQVWDFLCPKF